MRPFSARDQDELRAAMMRDAGIKETAAAGPSRPQRNSAGMSKADWTLRVRLQIMMAMCRGADRWGDICAAVDMSYSTFGRVMQAMIGEGLVATTKVPGCIRYYSISPAGLAWVVQHAADAQRLGVAE